MHCDAKGWLDRDYIARYTLVTTHFNSALRNSIRRVSRRFAARCRHRRLRADYWRIRGLAFGSLRQCSARAAAAMRACSGVFLPAAGIGATPQGVFCCRPVACIRSTPRRCTGLICWRERIRARSICRQSGAICQHPIADRCTDGLQQQSFRRCAAFARSRTWLWRAKFHRRARTLMTDTATTPTTFCRRYAARACSTCTSRMGICICWQKTLQSIRSVKHYPIAKFSPACCDDGFDDPCFADTDVNWQRRHSSVKVPPRASTGRA